MGYKSTKNAEKNDCVRLFEWFGLFVYKNDNTPIDEVLIAVQRTNATKYNSNSNATHCTAFGRNQTKTIFPIQKKLHEHARTHPYNQKSFIFNLIILLKGITAKKQKSTAFLLKIWLMPHRNTLPVE